MTTGSLDQWITLAPAVRGSDQSAEVFFRFVEDLLHLLRDDASEVDLKIDSLLQRNINEVSSTGLKAACSVLTDLARQGWSIRVAAEHGVQVRRPIGQQVDRHQEKMRVRAQELVKRDEQLREPATRRFIKTMERRNLYRGHFVSIFSLMRDGRELTDSLRRARDQSKAQGAQAFREAIDPYMQFIRSTSTCKETGLKLQDIWRYFRYTWANQYTSTPGRSINFLVRDRAREFHPIIGIGSIGSPIVQIRERDSWIGWNAETFVQNVSAEPSAKIGVWLNRIVRDSINEIFVQDFLEEGLLTNQELRMPSVDVVKRLVAYSATQRRLHQRFAQSQELKTNVKENHGGDAGKHWESRAKSHLFRSKRALALGDMLNCKIGLQRYLSEHVREEEVRGLVGKAEGRRLIRKVLLKAKADRVGTVMADITVCGALPPYSVLLGGKLVSMLAVSPEVIAEYRRRYKEQESEIASAMAGRPIVRPSDLGFLSTTSLYGVGSSQYNRVRIPAECIGGEPGEELRFIKIGRSEAFGTSHFSQMTVDLLVSLVEQSSNGLRVNSVFGEGVSPKFRKIRGGLEALGFPAEALLRHGRERILYGVPLVKNLRDYMLGMEEEAHYRFDDHLGERGTSEVVTWWYERWLAGRSKSEKVLTEVAGHTLVRPVRHGARVTLPVLEEAQGALFDDLED